MPPLEAANKKSNWFGVRRINIKDWKSPVSAQFKIRGIPYGILYGPNGKQIEASNKICWVAAQDPEKIKNME
ncbi:MAG: hypothetical protein HUK40_24270 [Desulfobacter sp.]|nr:hypothetical protein [Desulfobacter sp.]WDP85786.1 MAG: hypothetical protein HUN05_12130 [Desulfobacter sp.]